MKYGVWMLMLSLIAIVMAILTYELPAWIGAAFLVAIALIVTPNFIDDPEE